MSHFLEQQRISEERFRRFGWLALILVLTITSLLFYAFMSRFTNDFVWEVTKFFSPILFMFLWPLLGVTILGWWRIPAAEIRLITRFFPLAFLLSVTSVLGTLLLNSRFFTLLSIGLPAGLEVQIFLIALLGPAIEELLKVAPAIFLLLLVGPRPTASPGDDPPLSAYFDRLPGLSLRSERGVLLFGLLSGTTFTVLESLLYVTVNSAGAEPIQAFTQLAVRLGAPLHVFATTVATAGVFNALKRYHTRGGDYGRFDMVKEFLPYLLFAWVVHAIWNGTAILVSNYFPADDLSYLVIFALYGFVINLSLLGFLLYKAIHLRHNYHCTHCPLLTSSHNHENIPRDFLGYHLTRLPIPAFDKTDPKKGYYQSYLCQFCGVPSNGSTCANCGASLFTMCPTCSVLCAPTDESCPNCSVGFTSVVDSMMRPSLRTSDVFFVGVTAIVALSLLSSSVAVFAFANQSQVAPLINFMVLYLVFGFSGLVGVYKVLFTQARGEGLLVTYAFGTTLVASVVSMLLATSVVGMLTFAVESLIVGVLFVGVASYISWRYTTFLVGNRFITEV